RFTSAMTGSRLHSAFPSTTSLATMRGRKDSATVRSPLMAKLLPVKLLTLRAIGSRNRFQSKNAMSRVARTTRASNAPAMDLVGRDRVIAGAGTMRSVPLCRLVRGDRRVGGGQLGLLQGSACRLRSAGRLFLAGARRQPHRQVGLFRGFFGRLNCLARCFFGSQRELFAFHAGSRLSRHDLALGIAHSVS